MEDYLTSDKSVLDVGGNLAFFSLYISKYVNKVVVIEYNKTLCKIGAILKKKLSRNNVIIINSDFKRFITDKKFDIVLSFAIHKWIGESTQKYLSRLSRHLKKDGYILIESHAGKDRQYLEREIRAHPHLKIIKQGYTDDHQGDIRDFYYLAKK